MKKHDVWLVLPARNEEKHIEDIIVRSKKYVSNIVVVDDGSNDNTREKALNHKAIVLRHPINLGKGAALKTGCDYVVKENAKIIIVMDADGQHNPEDIPRFLEKIKNTDIVFGSRKLNKNMPLTHRLGNKFINKMSSFLFNIKINDTQSGFRVFKSKIYKKIRWNARDYSMESEMIARVGSNHLKYEEIIIDTIYRDRYKGTTIIDGIKIVWSMIKWKLIG